MAENRGVWGIDIGQAGLKAIRLRYAEAAGQALAVAFDYVPHPKILTQPDAIPEELIPQALEKFLSRNDVKGDLVAISVPGQTSLAKFIKLPPVEASKVAEIVKYEARQQIPFPLDDVIWTYQTLGGGVEESGYMLEAEVGLFAMKRDQVLSQLKPFTDAKIEPELIQIAPLALYNFLSYDQLGIRVGERAASADEYTIILDMGADNTTLLVSNGEKIWIRNVPIGGNHFTRALTKEMKLTFAKAEHLKCNATKSPDPRAVFQALRPVFNDYVSEIQRSIGYFSSVNRDAKITKVLGLGNGFKLAGLQKFLQQNLQYEVERVENFQGLVGDAVLSAPLFQENILSFAVPYGLALQALKLTRIHTSLLPPEMLTARLIRRKKPWAVAAAATLLFGFATTAVGYSAVWKSVHTERFGTAESEVSSFKTEVGGYASAYSGAQGENQGIKDKGKQLVLNLDAREYWLEIYKAINECLPRDQGDERDETEITKRHRIKLWNITATKHADLSTWYTSLRPAAKESMRLDDKATGPTGPGYVFTLEGVHYHHEKDNVDGQGQLYVEGTLLKNLKSWTVQQSGAPVPVRQLGITHPVLVLTDQIIEIDFDPVGRRLRANPGDRGNPGFENPGFENPGFENPAFEGNPGFEDAAPAFDGAPGFNRFGNKPGLQPGLRGVGPVEEKPKIIKIPQTKFKLQFAWKPTPKAERPAEPPGTGEAAAANGANKAPN